MTLKEAINAGYYFTGHYESEYHTEGRQKLKEKAREIRRQGCKAFVVKKHSGYAIYADDRYFLLQDKETYERILSSVESRKAEALKRYEEEIKAINEEAERTAESLAECNKKLGL